MHERPVTAVLGGLLDVIYPRVCVACGRPADRPDSYLCWECVGGVQVIQRPFCARCGDPIDGAADHRYTCWWCDSCTPYFDCARSAARYRGPIRRAVQALKYQGMTYLAGDLAQFIAATAEIHYRGMLLDAATYVPLHPRRRRERTFNQSELLAGMVSRRLGLPECAGSLRRTRATVTQTELNAAQRRQNVHNAFEVRRAGWVRGRRLLLVDDVMTTGATVNECCRVLKGAGAASVLVVTACRG